MKGLDYMLKWFKDCKSIESVKKTYRRLCKEYHPDLHGGKFEDEMKQINAEYEIAFNCFKNVHETAEDSTKTYTSSTDSTETAAEFMGIINALIHCEGVEIDLVGRWIWLTGNTYQYKDTIKELGFRYASKKKAWYWHTAEDVCKSRKGLSLDQIKDKYGCERFETVSTPKLATV